MLVASLYHVIAPSLTTLNVRSLTSPQNGPQRGKTCTSEDALEASYEGDELFSITRSSALLSSLTAGRAPPPKNRRRPSLKKRHVQGEDQAEVGNGQQSKVRSETRI